MVADVHIPSNSFSNLLSIFNQNWRNMKCHHCINTRSVSRKQFDTLLMQKIFSFIILFSLFGCTDTAKQKQPVSSIDTSLQQVKKTDTLSRTKVLSEEERKLRRKEYEEQERVDSTRLSQVLKTALAYANRNKGKASFQHEFEMAPDDSSLNVTTKMAFGHLFARDKKHLLIRRTIPWTTICSVFLLDKDKFENVCEKEPLPNTYIDDTIKDINGDNYKDFLVNWYPSAGCCRRDVFNVFIYQPQTGGFTKDYEFINPTFSPQERIIRGVKYGHPGEVGLYKYKWNGLKVDTLEFIYPYANHKGKFIKTKTQEYRPTEKEGIVLKSLPTEYRSIESIEWFLDY